MTPRRPARFESSEPWSGESAADELGRLDPVTAPRRQESHSLPGLGDQQVGHVSVRGSASSVDNAATNGARSRRDTAEFHDSVGADIRPRHDEPPGLGRSAEPDRIGSPADDSRPAGLTNVQADRELRGESVSGAIRPRPELARVAAAQEPSRIRPRDEVAPPPSTVDRRRQPETPAQPVVQISIGRIEVRAMPSPPAPVATVAPTQEPQRPTLTDYLRGDERRSR